MPAPHQPTPTPQSPTAYKDRPLDNASLSLHPSLPSSIDSAVLPSSVIADASGHANVKMQSTETQTLLPPPPSTNAGNPSCAPHADEGVMTTTNRSSHGITSPFSSFRDTPKPVISSTPPLLNAADTGASPTQNESSQPLLSSTTSEGNGPVNRSVAFSATEYQPHVPPASLPLRTNTQRNSGAVASLTSSLTLTGAAASSLARQPHGPPFAGVYLQPSTFRVDATGGDVLWTLYETNGVVANYLDCTDMRVDEAAPPETTSGPRSSSTPSNTGGHSNAVCFAEVEAEIARCLNGAGGSIPCLLSFDFAMLPAKYKSLSGDDAPALRQHPTTIQLLANRLNNFEEVVPGSAQTSAARGSASATGARSPSAVELQQHPEHHPHASQLTSDHSGHEAALPQRRKEAWLAAIPAAHLSLDSGAASAFDADRIELEQRKRRRACAEVVQASLFAARRTTVAAREKLFLSQVLPSSAAAGVAIPTSAAANAATPTAADDSAFAGARGSVQRIFSGATVGEAGRMMPSPLWNGVDVALSSMSVGATATFLIAPEDTTLFSAPLDGVAYVRSATSAAAAATNSGNPRRQLAPFTSTPKRDGAAKPRKTPTSATHEPRAITFAEPPSRSSNHTTHRRHSGERHGPRTHTHTHTHNRSPASTSTAQRRRRSSTNSTASSSRRRSSSAASSSAANTLSMVSSRTTSCDAATDREDNTNSSTAGVRRRSDGTTPSPTSSLSQPSKPSKWLSRVRDWGKGSRRRSPDEDKLLKNSPKDTASRQRDERCGEAQQQRQQLPAAPQSSPVTVCQPTATSKHSNTASKTADLTVRTPTPPVGEVASGLALGRTASTPTKTNATGTAAPVLGVVQPTPRPPPRMRSPSFGNASTGRQPPQRRPSAAGAAGAAEPPVNLSSFTSQPPQPLALSDDVRAYEAANYGATQPMLVRLYLRERIPLVPTRSTTAYSQLLVSVEAVSRSSGTAATAAAEAAAAQAHRSAATPSAHMSISSKTTSFHPNKHTPATVAAESAAAGLEGSEARGEVDPTVMFTAAASLQAAATAFKTRDAPSLLSRVAASSTAAVAAPMLSTSSLSLPSAATTTTTAATTATTTTKTAAAAAAAAPAPPTSLLTDAFVCLAESNLMRRELATPFHYLQSQCPLPLGEAASSRKAQADSQRAALPSMMLQVLDRPDVRNTARASLFMALMYVMDTKLFHARDRARVIPGAVSTGSTDETKANTTARVERASLSSPHEGEAKAYLWMPPFQIHEALCSFALRWWSGALHAHRQDARVNPSSAETELSWSSTGSHVSPAAVQRVLAAFTQHAHETAPVAFSVSALDPRSGRYIPYTHPLRKRTAVAADTSVEGCTSACHTNPHIIQSSIGCVSHPCWLDAVFQVMLDPENPSAAHGTDIHVLTRGHAAEAEERLFMCSVIHDIAATAQAAASVFVSPPSACAFATSAGSKTGDKRWSCASNATMPTSPQSARSSSPPGHRNRAASPSESPSPTPNTHAHNDMGDGSERADAAARRSLASTVQLIKGRSNEQQYAVRLHRCEPLLTPAHFFATSQKEGLASARALLVDAAVLLNYYYDVVDGFAMARAAERTGDAAGPLLSGTAVYRSSAPRTPRLSAAVPAALRCGSRLIARGQHSKQRLPYLLFGEHPSDMVTAAAARASAMGGATATNTTAAPSHAPTGAGGNITNAGERPVPFPTDSSSSIELLAAALAFMHPAAASTTRTLSSRVPLALERILLKTLPKLYLAVFLLTCGVDEAAALPAAALESVYGRWWRQFPAAQRPPVSSATSTAAPAPQDDGPSKLLYRRCTYLGECFSYLSFLYAELPGMRSHSYEACTMALFYFPREASLWGLWASLAGRLGSSEARTALRIGVQLVESEEERLNRKATAAERARSGDGGVASEQESDGNVSPSERPLEASMVPEVAAERFNRATLLRYLKAQL